MINDKFFTKNNLSFLENYINTSSPTGYEVEGQKVWMNYIENFVDKIKTDNYGTAYGIINPDAKFKVVIEAHSDEISWYVNYITSDGLIHVVRNGGSDQMIAPSKRVRIATENGFVDGVFGWPAIHTRIHGKDTAPKIEDIWIDVGADNKEEVEKMGVHVGCIITYPDEFKMMNDKYFCGRALDNRMGGFMIAEVARLLKENNKNLDFGLYITNSVQEEVGLNGAKMISETIKPNMAIVTDVTHDTSTPRMNVKKDGDLKCGKGPVIAYAPAVHHTVRNLIEKTAKENSIDFQRSALSRFTGTDTDAFAFSNGGVPSALISLPLRYMHTTVEMTHIQDVKNCILLIYNTLLNVKNNHNFNYFSH